MNKQHLSNNLEKLSETSFTVCVMTVGGKKERQHSRKLVPVEPTCVVLSHRRVDLINLFVFGYGVIDPFLNGQDVVFIAQVTGSLPCDLEPPRCRQGCDVHSCGGLNTEMYFERTVSM